MASSRILIASQTLGSSAASVTFSSIPSTYKDLVLKISSRSDNASVGNAISVSYNGAPSGTGYSMTYLRGSGSAAASSNQSNNDRITLNTAQTGSSATANTFNNQEIYIPNYAGSTAKPASSHSNTENNATESYITATATLSSSTAAISSIVLTSTGNFVSGSTFTLYGLSN